MSSSAGNVVINRRLSQDYDPISEEELEEAVPSKDPVPIQVYLRPRNFFESVADVLWIASAVFIIYVGDSNFNFIHLLREDERINRIPLYLGSFVGMLNIGVILYNAFTTCYKRKTNDVLEALSPSLAPVLILLGFLSFILFSVALWPVWSFLSIPLLLTLYMSLIVIAIYMPFGGLKGEKNIILPAY